MRISDWSSDVCSSDLFYRQQRVGLYGEEFWIVKLRTMRQDAELTGQAVWAEKDDPRITRLGYWLRKLRIDELPQTWTVLKGEMSFVGPRPERRPFVEDLEQHLRYYARSEEHTSELQSLMRISSAVIFLKKNNNN